MKTRHLTKMVCSLLVLALVMMLAACGGASDNSKNASNTDSKAGSAAGKDNQAPAEGEKKPEVKFPAKEIKFIVPVSPGGGMDTSARMLAKYWEKHLGGTIVVENMPGAEYNNGIYGMLKAKPDGHTVITFPGVIINQLFGGVDYDMKKFGWIGRISDSSQVAVVSKKSGIKSLDDLKKMETVKAGVTGLSSSQTIGQLLTAKEMGFKVQPITHKGATEAILSAIRGDADWTTAPDVTIIPYIKNGDVAPLWVAAEKRLKDLPDTPTLAELGFPKLTEVVAFHRIVATNPGTPPEILKKLQDSFKKAVEDPKFIEEYSKLGDPPSYLSGEKTAELVKDSLDAIKPNVDYLKSFK